MRDKGVIGGKVIEAGTCRGAEGLRVEAWKKNPAFDEAVGTAVTDKTGEFLIKYNTAVSGFRSSELVYKIFKEKTLVYTAEEVVVEEAKDSDLRVVITMRQPNEQQPHEFELSGKLTGLENIDSVKELLAVQVLVDGHEAAVSGLDEKGGYTLRFTLQGSIDSAVLRIVPSRTISNPIRHPRLPGLTRTVSGTRFSIGDSGSVHRARVDIRVGPWIADWIRTCSKIYRMSGGVYATVLEEINGVQCPVDITPIPGAKIEFFECDQPGGFPWFGTESEDYLGEAITDPDGNYSFSFRFSYLRWLRFPTDTQPDIRVRISQFFDGVWTRVFESPVFENIAETVSRSFFIPSEQAMPQIDAGSKPLIGFRFISCGLLPIDQERIVGGYATAKAGDPDRIANIEHQPFCGRLRIFGLFADADAVQTYAVQMAVADEFEPVGPWTPITDSLSNREWNDATHSWMHRVLGPDAATGRYINIDIRPEYDWHEHALKITWQTTNVADGYYALRIIGYKADNTVSGVHYMPIIRVDNSLPLADFSVDTPEVSDCGYMTLDSDRKIRFLVTAHDPSGHLYSYTVACSRGKHPEPAGAAQGLGRQNPAEPWNGLIESPVEFTVLPLPSALSACPSVSYHARLTVYGSSTDGYSKNSESQRITKELNLIVSE